MSKKRPRVFPGPAGATLRIIVRNHDDELGEPWTDTRTYRDPDGLVKVTHREQSRQMHDLMASYQYNDEPLMDLPNDYRGSLYTNETTERRGVSIALAQLDVADAQMWSRHPPEADVRVKAPALGEFFVDFTLGHDEEEREFQETMQAFVRAVKARLDERELPWLQKYGLSMGFVSAPPRRLFQQFTDVLIESIIATNGTPGTHEVVNPNIAPMIPQFQITKGGTPGFVQGGGLAMERGHANYHAVALERIADKRDNKTYETHGLPLWIVVGMSLPLIAPDFMRSIYESDVDLRHLSRAVVAASGNVVMFERAT